MTAEELEKLPFVKGCHVSFRTEHQQFYYCQKYGIKKCVITKMNKGGMEAGKAKTEWCYRRKWYTKVEAFLVAIKDIKYHEEETDRPSASCLRNETSAKSL